MERILTEQTTITTALRKAGCRRAYLPMMANVCNCAIHNEAARLDEAEAITATINLWRQRKPQFFS